MMNELFLIFKLSGRKFAVDFGAVTEIALEFSIQKIPNFSKEILGLANVRGNVLAVVDLAFLLGGLPANPGKKTGLIVMETAYKAEKMRCCVLADEILLPHEVSAGELSSGSVTVQGRSLDFAKSCFLLGGELIPVIDLAKILDASTSAGADLPANPS